MADKPLYIGPCVITNGNGGVHSVALIANAQGVKVAVPVAAPAPPKFPDQSVKVAIKNK
jgi:hypothetical protein